MVSTASDALNGRSKDNGIAPVAIGVKGFEAAERLRVHRNVEAAARAVKPLVELETATLDEIMGLSNFGTFHGGQIVTRSFSSNTTVNREALARKYPDAANDPEVVVTKPYYFFKVS